MAISVELDHKSSFVAGFDCFAFQGIKKPYNPILGETFRCCWFHPQTNSHTFYIAEQVSCFVWMLRCCKQHPPWTCVLRNMLLISPWERNLGVLCKHPERDIGIKLAADLLFTVIMWALVATQDYKSRCPSWNVSLFDKDLFHRILPYCFLIVHKTWLVLPLSKGT